MKPSTEYAGAGAMQPVFNLQESVVPSIPAFLGAGVRG
jgi:hypothetical protein